MVIIQAVTAEDEAASGRSPLNLKGIAGVQTIEALEAPGGRTSVRYPLRLLGSTHRWLALPRNAFTGARLARSCELFLSIQLRCDGPI